MSQSSHKINRASSCLCPHPSQTVQSKHLQPFCSTTFVTYRANHPHNSRLLSHFAKIENCLPYLDVYTERVVTLSALSTGNQSSLQIIPKCPTHYTHVLMKHKFILRGAQNQPILHTRLLITFCTSFRGWPL
jgi:hypothetical protein